MKVKKTAMKSVLKRPAAPPVALGELVDTMNTGDMMQKELARVQDDENGESEEAVGDEEVSAAEDGDEIQKRPAAKRPASESGSYEEKGWRNRGKQKFFARAQMNDEIPAHVKAVISEAKARPCHLITLALRGYMQHVITHNYMQHTTN